VVHEKKRKKQKKKLNAAYSKSISVYAASDAQGAVFDKK